MKINSKKVKIEKVRIGKGLVAMVKIPKDTVILAIKGEIVSADDVTNSSGSFQDNAYRFSEDSYISPEDEAGVFVNHSCKPNSKIVKDKKGLYLVAISDIGKGEEIFFDYSTVLARDDIWKMKCVCGEDNCRKIIKRYTTLPKGIFQDYLKLDIIPRYIQEI